jgi:hypothetical protein
MCQVNEKIRSLHEITEMYHHHFAFAREISLNTPLEILVVVAGGWYPDHDVMRHVQNGNDALEGVAGMCQVNEKI